MAHNPKWKRGDIVSLFWQARTGEIVPNPPGSLLIIDVNPDATGPHPVYKLMSHDGLIRTRYEFELRDPEELDLLRSEQHNAESPK